MKVNGRWVDEQKWTLSSTKNVNIPLMRGLEQVSFKENREILHETDCQWFPILEELFSKMNIEFQMLYLKCHLSLINMYGLYLKHLQVVHLLFTLQYFSYLVGNIVFENYCRMIINKPDSIKPFLFSTGKSTI